MSDTIDTMNKFMVGSGWADREQRIQILGARKLDSISPDDTVNLIGWLFAMLDHEHQAMVPDFIKKVLST